MTQLPVEGRSSSEAEHSVDPSELRVLFGNRADAMAAILRSLGAEELLQQATGRRVFTTMPDLRLYRTYRLYEALTGSPHEASDVEATGLIASFFKITDSAAQRQIALAMARYANELRTLSDERIRRALIEATYVKDGSMTVFLPVGWIRQRVVSAAKGFAGVGVGKPLDDDPRRLQFPDDLFVYLCKEFSVQLDDVIDRKRNVKKPKR